MNFISLYEVFNIFILLYNFISEPNPFVYLFIIICMEFGVNKLLFHLCLLPFEMLFDDSIIVLNIRKINYFDIFMKIIIQNMETVCIVLQYIKYLISTDRLLLFSSYLLNLIHILVKIDCLVFVNLFSSHQNIWL